MRPIITAAESWSEISRLLDTALSLPPADRMAWLAALPPEHAALEPRLRLLLQRSAEIETGDFLGALPRLESLPVDEAVVRAPTGRVHDTIGPYRLLREIGSGGMGTVWLAERTDGVLNRPVALKLPNWSPRHSDFAERLAREREILATLTHPHIARIYDAGLGEQGQPYLALEYVEGVPLDEYCASRGLDLRARLRLFLQVAAAVAYAHSKLVVHRDLKPANVLVTEGGEVRLLDFGVAKLLEGGRTHETLLTQFAGRAYTPEYASPEQIRGEPLGTASDIYSLGVMLFRLATDQRPYRLRRESRSVLEEAVLEAEPSRPSDLVGSRQRRELRGGLDAIALKCLRKHPEGRYATVTALIDDIDRFLSDRPVMARAGSNWYRAGRFVRRHRLSVAAGAAVLVAVAAALVGVLHQSAVAREEAQRAAAVQDFLIAIFRQNSQDQEDPLKARGTTARELLAAGVTRLEADVALPPAARDRLYAVIAQLYTDMDLRERAAELVERRIPWLRERGDSMELARALVQFAENAQETSRRAEALPALREAERLVLAHRPLDEVLAGQVYSYLSNQLNLSDPSAARLYASRAVTHLRRTRPNSEAMLGALFMLAQADSFSNPKMAAEHWREALQVTRALHGEDHTLSGAAALFLADAEASLFENTAAERNFREADRVARRATDVDHYLPLQVDLRFGLFLIETGRTEEGLMRLNRALSVALGSRGEEDRAYTAWAREYAGRASFYRGLLDDARELAKLSVSAHRRAGEGDLFAKTSELMFDIELAAGNMEQAEVFIRDARAARVETGTAAEPGFLHGLLLREGHLALAREDAALALKLFEEVAGAEVPSVAQFLRYKVAAQIGRSRAELELGRLPAAISSARAAIEMIGELGSPAQLKLIEADAWLRLGHALAKDGACALADDAWNQANAALSEFSDPASFRFAALRSARESAGAKCPNTSVPQQSVG